MRVEAGGVFVRLGFLFVRLGFLFVRLGFLFVRLGFLFVRLGFLFVRLGFLFQPLPVQRVRPDNNKVVGRQVCLERLPVEAFRAAIGRPVVLGGLLEGRENGLELLVFLVVSPVQD